MSCAECKTRKAEVYIVETKKVLCKDCLGRVTYPGIGSNITVEVIKAQQGHVANLTLLIMHSSVVVLFLVVSLRSGVGEEYFKGDSMCPVLSVPRHMLARFDPTIFYYFKPNLSTYCDIEDSFWRLLMDGWLRGVVGGSDSLLLLVATFSKAWLFKKAFITFVRPVYALVYACCGLVLSTILDSTAVALHAALPASGGVVANYFKAGMRMPTKMAKWDLGGKKTACLANLKTVFTALAMALSVRFLVWAVGLHRLACLGHDISRTQLALEPAFFFYVASVCAPTPAKKAAAAAGGPAPFTVWRERPCTDFIALLSYVWERITRQYDTLKVEAEKILHILLDDIFNLVVMLRVLGIVFELAPLARQVACLAGLGDVVERHRAWFHDGTGVTDTENGANYLSGYIGSFGLFEFLQIMRFVKGAAQGEAVSVITHRDRMGQLFWRLLVPYALYRLKRKWDDWRAAKKKQNDAEWKGKDWKDGGYARMLDQHGTFWNKVGSLEEWVPEPPPPPKKK